MFTVDESTFANAITWLVSLGVIVNTTKTPAEKKRVEIILAAVEDDKKARLVIENVLKSAVSYVEKIFTAETTLSLQQNRLEGEELRLVKERLDGNRRISHNALISDLRIANRYLFKTFGKAIPVGGVYSAEPSHLADTERFRSAIGSWAGRLVVAYFNDRSL
jgi:hypothetical protein